MSPSLVDMPELVMERVLKFLDFKACLTLRHVCRDLRNFIDDEVNYFMLPDSKFSKITVTVELNIIRFKFTGSRGSIWLTYNIRDNMCTRMFNSHKRLLMDVDPVKVAVCDLDLVLRFQKTTMKRIIFNLQNSDLTESLTNILERRKRKIKVESLVVLASQPYQILSIVDGKVLKEIVMRPHVDQEDFQILDFSEIVETEQWKNAELLDARNFIFPNEHLKNLTHFSRANIWMHRISVEEIDYLKNHCRNNIEIRLQQPASSEELSIKWGPSCRRNVTKDDWYFRTRDAEKILRITNDERFRDIVMSIRKMRVGSIPENAEILEF
ncbi:hypothetical protein GCK72_021362 [Caenorhabditis remanei]|uniref:F-box domain-containing protein n=1 Tax=Caenorhabditis remanei TaxID=31234 RepID=A0A6A5GHX9_CAERE|nr:hypothetical protein GCK72_021362 [Caenorhabditis remanei]KAF1754798.1 hypothetical protein GCK72_021362 [Caenorhabditis remanei]